MTMNVAHCIHGLGLGGAQQVVRFIVRGTDPKTYRHYVYPCKDGVFRGGVERAGAIVRIIERRIAKFDPFWVANLARTMRNDNVDIVHVHLFGDSLHGYLAARLAGPLPVVMTLHGSPHIHTRLQRIGYRWLMVRTTRNVACSDSVQRLFLDSAGNQPIRMQTISNGIEDTAISDVAPPQLAVVRRKLGFDPDVTLIGTVGRMVEVKGFGYLIRAFAKLCRSRDRDLRLVLLGEGPLRETLQEQAVREGVGDFVLFPGFRPDAAELVHGFDLVAFSSISEGLPIALLEAMAASRCIVATDAAGLMDALTHDREALIVPAGDVGRLAEALGQALADADLRERLGQAARQRFLAEFTAERMVACYDRVYREVYQEAHGGVRATANCP